MNTSPEIKIHSRVCLFADPTFQGEVVSIGFSQLEARDVEVFGVNWDNGNKSLCDATEITLANQTKRLSLFEAAIAGVVPNCDGVSDPAELETLRGEIKRTIEGLKELQNFCEAKQHAMELRLTGRIESALKFEACCNDVYAKLPDFVRVW